MRARLLVIVLLLFVVSAGNVRAVGPHEYPSVDFDNVDDLIAALNPDTVTDPSRMQPMGYQSSAEQRQLMVPTSLTGNETDDRDLQWIYPPDERLQLSPAVTEVAYLETSTGTCTGTFIGPRVVLTAAHCLYDQIYETWVDYVAVVPGKDGDYDPLGHVFASSYYVPVGWGEVDPNSLDYLYYDYGIVVLDESLGDLAGWQTVGVLQDASLNTFDFFPFTIGYPGDKPQATQWLAGAQTFAEVTDDLLFNHIDQTYGQSGSAMMRGSDAAIVGVVSSGLSSGDDYVDVTRRITAPVLDFMTGVCIEEGCSFSYFVESETPTPVPPVQPPAPNPPPPTTPPSSSTAFQNTWARTDQPVVQGQANRTWMWGPTAFSPEIYEPYAETPGGQRTVQYFDKSRMEVTNPTGDPNSIWYVTNGLLVNELMTGKLQLGNNTFEQHRAAQVNVAGDADDSSGPTYATFGALVNSAPLAEGSLITQRVDRAGAVLFDPGLAGESVTAARYVPETNHTVASVFWNFMNSEGLVFENGSNVYAPLFENAFYATGYPVTEAYWATVKVGGSYRNVLIQVFERRVLTYTPGNGPGWDVEAGNVGQHYYQWRYTQIPNE